jgi:hypothetical protein
MKEPNLFLATRTPNGKHGGSRTSVSARHEVVLLVSSGSAVSAVRRASASVDVLREGVGNRKVVVKLNPVPMSQAARFSTIEHKTQKAANDVLPCSIFHSL